MKFVRLLLLFLPLVYISCSPRKTSSGNGENGWVSLFNGKNLNGWTPKFSGYNAGENYNNTFRVQDGMLSTRYDQYKTFNSKFGALFYNKKFTNFRLRVEYRFVGDTTAGAPSWGYRDGGIQYYCQSPQSMTPDQPFPVCLEYNLLGGNGHDERASGEICASGMYVFIDGKRNASYCTPPPVKRTLSGDQWVTAEIDVRNGKIEHYINGEQVIEFENPHYDTANAMVKKLGISSDGLVKDGYISLQSNSNPMDFRKVEIKEY